MKRPSQYLLLSFVAFGAVVWWMGPGGDSNRAPAPRVAHNPSPDTRPVVVVTVRGRVLSHLGLPIQDVEVRPVLLADGLLADGLLADGEDVARTDVEGRFAFQIRGIEPRNVEFRAPGYAPAVRRVHPAARRAVFLVLQQQLPWGGEEPSLEPPGVGLLAGEGFLKDEAGRQVADALVTVVETGMCARSDVTGRFRVALPAGPATLIGQDGRGGLARVELRPPRQTQGVVPLPDLIVVPELSLVGLVRNPSGSPIGGVSIEIAGSGLRHAVATSEDGLFRWDGLPTGSYVVIAHPLNRFLGFRTEVELMAGAVHELTMVAERPMVFRVVNQQDKPQARVHVVGRELTGLRRVHAQADEEGLVELGGLTGEDTVFEVRTPGDHELLEVFGLDEDRLVVSGR